MNETDFKALLELTSVWTENCFNDNDLENPFKDLTNEVTLGKPYIGIPKKLVIIVILQNPRDISPKSTIEKRSGIKSMQGLYSNGNNLSGEHSIIVKTPTKSIIVNPEKSSSCAYTSAMKALQGRIKDLERQLQSKSVIHGKFWEEKLVKFKATYEAINKDLKDKLSKSKCENDFLKKQIEQLNYEKENHIEKNAVERNQWREEKEKFKDELCMKNENIKKYIYS